MFKVSSRREQEESLRMPFEMFSYRGMCREDRDIRCHETTSNRKVRFNFHFLRT